MPKICFAIPTWNRAEKLRKCVESIAEQIKENKLDARIFISDNCSDDDTQSVIEELISKYEYIDAYRRPSHGGYIENLSDVTHKASGEYIWWFGDDDELLNEGLKTVLAHLSEENYSVLSAGNGWFKPHSGKMITGTNFDICNYIGWNQYIGWISSVVLRNDIAKKVAKIITEEPFQNDAYAHVGAILYAAASEDGAFIDLPIAQPIAATTEVDNERWNLENIHWRFFLLIDTFKFLINERIIPSSVKPNFFKYIDKYFWDNLIFNMITTIDENSPFKEDGWSKILTMAEMIEDFETKKNIRARCLGAYSITNELISCRRKISELDNHLGNMMRDASTPFLSMGLPENNTIKY